MTDTPMADQDLTAAASYAVPPAECDLIMKGGITSGLVYPLAACRLATRYRFRQVGGASAGAIAAALTAAAEYQRRSAPPSAVDGGSTGFLGLAEIPGVMGKRLSTLFQPVPALRSAYRLLTASVEPGWSKLRKLVVSLWTVVGAAPLLFAGVWLAVTLAFSLPFWFTPGGPGWPGWVSLALGVVLGKVAALLVAIWRFVRTTMATLPEHGYGICSGLAQPGHGGQQALTEWLTEKLDRVAGLAAGEGPLTFGHLYGERASEVFRRLRLDEDDAPADPERRAEFRPMLDLQMMTTCLTFQRPYVFPFHTKVFHFCPDCWVGYFPPAVVAQLVATGLPASEKTQRVDGVDVPIDQHCHRHPGTLVRRLPAAPDLPVVVGVRLSLSFPMLISAVPFQTVDFSRSEGNKGLIEVWFSDGGISSNFPIHFFDTLLPSRPTFGITLADVHPDYPEQMVFRPKDNGSGILPRAVPISGVVSFLTAVVETMHNWVDTMAIPAPGFRDRVVELRTRDGEGGLNLKMKPETITDLGRRGDQAALTLEDFDWDNHRWIRYRTAMAGMADTLDGMDRVGAEYRAFVAARDGGSYRFSRSAREDAAMRAADLAATEELLSTAGSWREDGYPASQGNIPDPRPVLRPVMKQ